MSIIRLLELEYLKFKKNSVVTLLLSSFLLLAPVLILLGKKIFQDSPPPFPSNSIFFEFTTVWEYQGYVGSWLVFFFLGFMIIYTITSEVSNKTMRQNIITGMTRKEYFLGKLTLIIAISIIATLIYAVSSMVIGMIHTEGWDLTLMMDNNMAILRYFLMCMGYLSFGFMVAMVIRSSGLSIFFYFTYILIIELILKWAVSLNIVSQIEFIPNSIINYWPMNTIEDLMPNPVLRIPGNFMRSNEINFDLMLSSNHAIIFAMIYIVSFISIAWWSFTKKDL